MEEVTVCSMNSHGPHDNYMRRFISDLALLGEEPGARGGSPLIIMTLAPNTQCRILRAPAPPCPRQRSSSARPVECKEIHPRVGGFVSPSIGKSFLVGL